MRLRWAIPALRDMGDIHAFIAKHNPQAALKIARLLRAQAEGLAAHPQMGRLGRVEGARELVVAGSNFLIAYRVTETTVDILGIRHAMRQWPKRLDD